MAENAKVSLTCLDQYRENKIIQGKVTTAFRNLARDTDGDVQAGGIGAFVRSVLRGGLFFVLCGFFFFFNPFTLRSHHNYL